MLRDCTHELGWGLETHWPEELAGENAPSESEKESPQCCYVSQGHVPHENRNYISGYSVRSLTKGIFDFRELMTSTTP